MFIHDIIKIKYALLGYLPNYPYHLISDKEMFDAFIKYDTVYYEDTGITEYVPNIYEGFFVSFYPAMPATDDEYRSPTHYYPDTAILRKYDYLMRSICMHIDNYLKGKSDSIPDWVYSYMLGAAIGPNSDKLDIHDVIYSLGTDNPDDDYDSQSSIACYNESVRYLTSAIPNSETVVDEYGCAERPYTMFGEPHIIKSLRLSALKM